MQTDIFRVALIGPESTGKTTLCMELADHYKTRWVPEFSRKYIGDLKRPYTKDDIIHCAEKQSELEDEIKSKANKLLFTDTEWIVYKVWMLDVYGECPEWMKKKIVESKYDLYLLTSLDLPFMADPVRENPHRRQYFFDWYKSELERNNFPYFIIKGIGKERLSQAINIINSCIS